MNSKTKLIFLGVCVLLQNERYCAPNRKPGTSDQDVVKKAIRDAEAIWELVSYELETSRP